MKQKHQTMKASAGMGGVWKEESSKERFYWKTFSVLTKKLATLTTASSAFPRITPQSKQKQSAFHASIFKKNQAL